VRYWRWDSNALGPDPGDDWGTVEISNDGGDVWGPVERTKLTTNAWIPITFAISEFVTPTATMRMRFVADASGPPSPVEAAVDDFELLAFPTGGADPLAAEATAPVPTASAPRSVFALAPAAPNPFTGSTGFRYTLDAPGEVRVRVLDVSGRLVRTLAAGT